MRERLYCPQTVFAFDASFLSVQFYMLSTMKASQNLAPFIYQLRISACHTHISIPLRTQLLSQNTPASRTLHTHISKLKSISPLSRTQRNALRPSYIPKALHRPSSSHANRPGSSFLPHVAQKDSPAAFPTSTTNQTPVAKPPDSPSSDRQRPVYQLTFTCRPCGHRSAHEISKHGYHTGTVLITCPKCKNRHVISDHLKVIPSPQLPSPFRKSYL